MLYVGSFAWVCAKARQSRRWMCCSLPVSVCPNASAPGAACWLHKRTIGAAWGWDIINKKEQANKPAQVQCKLIRGLHSPCNRVQIKWLRRNSISRTVNGRGRLKREICTWWPPPHTHTHHAELLSESCHRRIYYPLPCLLLQRLSNKKTVLACRTRLWK